MRVEYPTEPEQLEHGVIRWDLPTERKGGLLFVIVECECGAQRSLSSYDFRRKNRPMPGGWCAKCRRRAHYSKLNNKRGPESSRFKGMSRLDRSGYVYLSLYPGDLWYEEMGTNGRHGYCRYVLEHRYVMAKHLARPLNDWEHVHHKDQNKANNALENLEILDGKTHAVITKLEAEVRRLTAERDSLHDQLTRLRQDLGLPLASEEP